MKEQQLNSMNRQITSNVEGAQKLITAGRFSGSVLKLVTLLALLVGSVSDTRAETGSHNPRVIPPNASYGGHTYGEWQALAYQWLDSVPAPENPVIPGNDAMIGNGQTGPVWFILTAITGSTVERDFTIPPGKGLCVFIVSAEWDNVLCTEPPTDYSVDQLRSLAAGYIDSYGDIEVQIDGVPINNVQQYRSTTPVFSLTLPADNIDEFFGCSNGAGTYGPCVADGYTLLLPPPSIGEHIIDEKMVQHVVPGDPSQDLHFEFIFRITVAP